MYLSSDYKRSSDQTKSMEAMKYFLIFSDDISRRQKLFTVVNFLSENCRFAEFSKATELLKVGAEIDGVFIDSSELSLDLHVSEKFPIIPFVAESQQTCHERESSNLVERLSILYPTKCVYVFNLPSKYQCGETLTSLSQKTEAPIERHIINEDFAGQDHPANKEPESSIPSVGTKTLLLERINFKEYIRKSERKHCAIVDVYPALPVVRALNNILQQAMDWLISVQPGGYLEFFIEQLVAKKAVGDDL